MAHDRKADHEIIARMERAARAQGRMLWTVMLAFAVIIALLAGGFVLHLPREVVGAPAFLVLLAWIVSVFLNRDYLPPSADAFSDADLLRKTLDAQQQRFRWMYVFWFALLILFAAMTTMTILLPRNAAFARHLHDIVDRPGAMAPAIELSVFALLMALMVCFGPMFLKGPLRRALNDELTRAQQHRAAIFGYILSVIALCAVLIAQLVHASWAALALPGTIAAVIVLPAFISSPCNGAREVAMTENRTEGTCHDA